MCRYHSSNIWNSFRGSCSLHRFRTSVGKDEFRSLFQCHSAVEHAQTLLTSYILHTRAHQCAQESCGESPPWWPSTDSPRAFISVAGGGGRNHRRLNGREVSARWGSVQSCSEKEKRRRTKRWAVLLEGDILRKKRRVSEMGGKELPMALCVCCAWKNWARSAGSWGSRSMTICPLTAPVSPA